MLVPRAKDPLGGPSLEENVAVIQTIFGENSRAISILTRLLQTPYDSPMYPFALTPALLRLDPIWDSFARRSRFPKTLRGKEAMKRSWEIIADNLSKAGWSWGWVSAVDSEGRTIRIVDAHRDCDGGQATHLAFRVS